MDDLRSFEDRLDGYRKRNDKFELDKLSREIDVKLDELDSFLSEKDSLIEIEECSAIYAGKKVAYYAESLNAFYNSSLDRQKTLITVMVATFGFLLSSLDPKGTFSHLYIFFIGVTFVFFILSLVSSLSVMNANRSQLRDTVRFSSSRPESENYDLLKKSIQERDDEISRIDRWSIFLFGIFVIISSVTFLIGVSSG